MNIRQETSNTFSDGLMLDLNPISMPNTALTNCLNGTVRTYNGNENMLQNDMGNARVETAMLPTGYIPLGSTSFGGIIYIVSYNPIEKKYLIGSFPSPERNLSKDELKDSTNSVIDLNGFCDENGWKGDTFGSPDNIIMNYYLKINLLKDPIYPGDKYKIYSDNLPDSQYISSWDEQNKLHNVELYPKYLKFDIISTLSDGKIITLTDNSVWNQLEGSPYYIYPSKLEAPDGNLQLEEYRGLVGSNYDTYVSNSSGQLGIVAKLEVPTMFSVGYDVIVLGNEYQFYFYLNWSNDNKGEHKNRINPSGISINVQGIQLDPSNIMLKKVNSSEPPVYPDILENLDYATTIAPDKYYFFDSSELQQYITSGVNYFDSTVKRKNDGSDFLYLIKGPVITKKLEVDQDRLITLYEVDGKEISLKDGNILEINLMPCMPFGKLKFLERTISLDITQINSGNVYLNNYQYYVDNESINVDFYIESYLPLGESIKGGTIDLYPLSKCLELNIELWAKLNTYNLFFTTKDLIGSDRVVKDIKIDSISGLQHIVIEKNKYNELKENPNRIYVVKFTFNQRQSNSDEKNIYFYRLLFANGIFNNAYGKDSDFKDLYLYNPKNNYGLKPVLNLVSNSVPDYRDISPNFSKYSNSEKTIKLNKLYKITHKIDSDFSLDSNLGDSLSLYTTIAQGKFLDKEIISSDDRIIINDQSTSEIKISGTTIKIENEFDVKIPHTLDYTSPKSLLKHSLTRLKDGISTHKITLQHHSREEENGKLTLFSNVSSGYNDEDSEIEVYECVDQSANITFNVGAIESYLKGIMNDNSYDYITVLFGVSNMGDKNCAYGYKEFGSYTESYYFKLNEKPVNWFAKVTCVRNADSVSLVHKKSLKLTSIGDIRDHWNYWDNDKCISYIDYDWVLHGNESKKPTDGTIIPTTQTLANRVFKYESDYLKYKPTGEVKTIYGISNIDYVLNPTVTVNYIISVKPSDLKVIIEGVLVEEPKGEPAHNLSIQELDNLQAIIPLKTTINTEDAVDQLLMLDSKEYAWDSNTNQMIGYEELSKVFDLEKNIIPWLNVSNGVLLLSLEAISKLASTQWYFGWEDTEGNKGNIINYNLFKKSKLWYKMQYTHSLSSLNTISPERILLYEITCDTDIFTKGQSYLLKIERVSMPSNYIPNEILIICDGGTSDPITFVDKGESLFETTISVTPTEDICQVTLSTKDDEDISIGSFIFENVQTPINP